LLHTAPIASVEIKSMRSPPAKAVASEAGSSKSP